MIRNYCISGLRSLKELPQLFTVQYTLNSRTFPSKRNTVTLLREMAPYYNNTDVIIHGDYIYECISRFAYFTPEVQNAILNEVISIVNYAAENPRIKGIVVHTDYPIRKECYQKGVNYEKITDAYQSTLWNSNAIVAALSESIDVVEYSILEFYRKFNLLYQGPIGCKIHLENTVHTGPNDEGCLEYLVSLLDKHPILKDLFGICWDWEHEGAISGRVWSMHDRMDTLCYLPSPIVHMNCIPEDAPLGLGKDRHSYTTIYDCSVYPASYYNVLADFLNTNNIPFVREVKEEVMYKEMEQALKEQN